MTVDEYNRNLNKFIGDIVKNNRPFGIAVQSTTQKIASRIFVEGRKSNGAEIGQYNSTTPLYVNPNTSPSKKGISPPKGKEGQTTFKNGKPHKTTYVESYKRFRELIGRPTKNINLVLSDDLFSDFRKGASEFQAKATKINVNQYNIQLDREINGKKIEGLTERFGNITDPMKEEYDGFYKVVDLELRNDLQKYGLT